MAKGYPKGPVQSMVFKGFNTVDNARMKEKRKELQEEIRQKNDQLVTLIIAKR